MKLKKGKFVVVCHDDFEGLMSTASFPRTRESRQNNRRPLLDLPGCPLARAWRFWAPQIQSDWV